MGVGVAAAAGEEDVEAAVVEIDQADLIEVPLVGVGYRQPLVDWLFSCPPEVSCVEITAEHFFDFGQERLEWLRDNFPVFVHGLGLSLGTPGPLDETTLEQFAQVVRVANPEWISEHVAFTRSTEVDLGHLNPLAPTETALRTLIDHARQLMDHCQKPLILENVTSFLKLSGEMSEPEFLNRLCDQSGCGLLLDVTNLFINARNHRFDETAWLDELNPEHVVQLHVVGYSQQGGAWQDYHGAAIQPELFALVREVVQRTLVRAVIVERDTDFPPIQELTKELQRLDDECVAARQLQSCQDV